MKNIIKEEADKYQDFFNFLSQEHGLTPTISEMDEIVSEAKKFVEKYNTDSGFHAQQLEKSESEIIAIAEFYDIAYCAGLAGHPMDSRYFKSGKETALSVFNTKVKESQQLEKDNWVSVSERFPSENQTVWCYSEKLDNVFLGEYVYVMNEGWFWAESNGVIYASGGKIVTECEIDDFDVSHWYPTPTLPKKLTTQTL